MNIESGQQNAGYSSSSELVQVILYDGRVIVVGPRRPRRFLKANNKGKLRGCDPRTNVILSDCVEREYSTDQGVEMIPLGLYMIKGDNV